MIEIKELRKSFGGFPALDGLNLTVPTGSVYGLVGPNGAGKTTAIKHLTGVYRQDSGEVLLDGVPVWENPAAKAKIAYIPDEVYFFPQAGIRDMAEFYRGVYPGFSEERYRRLGEAFALEEKAPMKRFSRGMQKQAAFRLAMSLMPEVLVLDEPVDGLDPVMRRQIWTLLLADVAERGMTVLVSSHNLRELEDVCDHVGIIHAGKTLVERSLSELQDNMVKVQLVLPDGAAMPEGLNILHESRVGQVRTLILRGRSEEISAVVAAAGPLFFDLLPLTLEEIFIYELGGEHYAVRDVLL
jgi:ABC-2 type transport system ATP-binding protein